MKTYDIINAGPRNRFMANGRIVSNSGRLIQPQNLARPTIKNVDEAIAFMLDGGDVDGIEMFFGPALEVVASCMRGCLIPRPGYKYFTPDLSQIEARMVAYLAGQQDILEVFARGEDVYTFTADKLGFTGPNKRQEGKVVVLACIGEGTLVLTDVGLLPIQNVTLQHKIWDGLEWVNHQGLIAKGQKETLNFCGARLTPEHAVLCGKTWMPAGYVARSEKLRRRALLTASVNCPSPDSLSVNAAGFAPLLSAARAGGQNTLWMRSILERGLRHVATRARALHNRIPVRSIFDTRIFVPIKNTVHDYLIAYQPVFSGAITPKINYSLTTGDGESLSTNHGERLTGWETARRGVKIFFGIFSRLTAGITRNWTLTASRTIKGMLRGICALFPEKETSQIEGQSQNYKNAFLNSKKRIETYDLAFAGPRNRFTIWTDRGPLIVHNCGFGMGPAKFAQTAEGYGLLYSLQRAEEIIYGWRDENEFICKFWWDTDGGAKECIREARRSSFGSAKVRINDFIVVEVQKARNGSPLMTILLPSGRRLFYRDVALEVESPDREIAAVKKQYDNEEIDEAEMADLIAAIEAKPRREGIVYSGIHQVTRQWGRVRTYGGKLVENIVQATARDVICDQALAVDDAGLGQLDLSVHDELILEVPEDEAEERKEKILEIMCKPPEWAPGLPVKAAGEIVERYGKG